MKNILTIRLFLILWLFISQIGFYSCNNSVQETTVELKNDTIPNDYLLYKNSEYGFSFLYKKN